MSLHPNQHYVSQVLLRRFKNPGSPLHCYQVETGAWKQRNEANVCSAPCYNQLLISGHPPDNTIDASLWEEENRLGSLKTLEALDESANRTLTELPQEVYENMCKYCAHLELISVFSKPAAVAVFLIEINMELEKGEYNCCADLISQKRRSTIGEKSEHFSEG